MSWLCPKCKAEMMRTAATSSQGAVYVCADGHKYDEAKEGYVNLLLANKKSSTAPGDNSDMVAARARFLSQGFYQPLLEKITACYEEYFVETSEPAHVLDCGCGEGFYSRMLLKQCPSFSSAFVSAIDVSKPAVKKAAVTAKRLSDVSAQTQYAVANSFDIPLNSVSVDAALSVFAPFAEAELHRVLKREGVFIRVLPGPNHLRELKDQLYQTPKLSREATELPLFKRIMSASLTHNINLAHEEDFQSLVAMTPLHWKTRESNALNLSDLSGPAMTADFLIEVFKPVDNPMEI